MGVKFEREVISIPASGTIDIIYKYRIHAHPDKLLGYNYKSALYYTFRRKKGVMEKLFTLDSTVSLNPKEPTKIDQFITDSSKKERILNYLKERNAGYGFNHTGVNYKFYVLNEVMELPNHPRKPNQNNHCYLKLHDLLNSREFVKSSEEEDYVSYKTTQNITPEEIDSSKSYIEGTVQKVIVNKYERNPKARQQCLDYYGYSCFVCGFNFEKEYGKIAKYIIHVHHLKPLSDIRTEYILDPIKDLRPICPNCHTVIHSIYNAKMILHLKA